MYELLYETQIDVKVGKKLKGWMTIKSTLKPESFTFSNDMMSMSFEGFCVCVTTTGQTMMIRYPWAKVEDMLVNISWLHDNGLGTCEKKSKGCYGLGV